MRFLRRVHGVTLGNKVFNCEICKSPECRDTSPNTETQLRWFGYMSRKSHERLPRRVLPGTFTKKRPRPQVDGLLLQPCLVPSWCGAGRHNNLRFCWPWGSLCFSEGCCFHTTLPRRKGKRPHNPRPSTGNDPGQNAEQTTMQLSFQRNTPERVTSFHHRRQFFCLRKKNSLVSWSKTQL